MTDNRPGYLFTAGEELTADKVNRYLATDYQYATDNTSHSLTGLTAATFQDYTGQLSVDIDVNANGVLLVRWGFEGRNTASATATCRLGINMSGANTVSASTNLSCCCNVNGGATFHTSTRMHIYTGLTPGTTTIKTQVYPSSGTTATVDNQFLLAQNY